MTDNLHRIRAEIEAIPPAARTAEQTAALRLACRGLGLPEPPESLADLAAVATRGNGDTTDTEPPPAAVEPPRALSGTLSDVFTARLSQVLSELEWRGYGPRAAPIGSTSENGRRLYHEASDLKTIFDGLAAMQKCGLHSAVIGADERKKLYERVTHLEREVGAFLSTST